MSNLGIPYMGSKRAIAKDIIKIIMMYKPNAKYFYDVFGGGASITLQAREHYKQVFYNEKDERIYNLFKFLIEYNGDTLPIEWYKFVDRESFKSIINSD